MADLFAKPCANATNRSAPFLFVASAPASLPLAPDLTDFSALVGENIARWADHFVSWRQRQDSAKRTAARDFSRVRVAKTSPLVRDHRPIIQARPDQTTFEP